MATFPNSKYTFDANQRITYLCNQLAKHELNIANYYLYKKMYIAAINRADNIINKFERNNSTIQALEVLVQSYNALGLESLAKESFNKAKKLH